MPFHDGRAVDHSGDWVEAREEMLDGLHRYFANSARNVTTPHAGTEISSFDFFNTFSLVSLSHTFAGLDHVSFARDVEALAPKRRMMQALPSSLGLSAVTSTSDGST